MKPSDRRHLAVTTIGGVLALLIYDGVGSVRAVVTHPLAPFYAWTMHGIVVVVALTVSAVYANRWLFFSRDSWFAWSGRRVIVLTNACFVVLILVSGMNALDTVYETTAGEPSPHPLCEGHAKTKNGVPMQGMWERRRRAECDEQFAFAN